MNTLSRTSPKNTKVLNLTFLTPYYTYIPEHAKILNCRPQAQEPGALGPDSAVPDVEQEGHQHTPGGFEAPGFGISCQGFRVWGLGFRVQGLGFRVPGLGFRVRVWGFEFRV